MNLWIMIQSYQKKNHKHLQKEQEKKLNNKKSKKCKFTLSSHPLFPHPPFQPPFQPLGRFFSPFFDFFFLTVLVCCRHFPHLIFFPHGLVFRDSEETDETSEESQQPPLPSIDHHMVPQSSVKEPLYPPLDEQEIDDFCRKTLLSKTLCMSSLHLTSIGSIPPSWCFLHPSPP